MAKQLEEKVKMAEKPEDAGNVPEFEKIIRSNKKSILAYHQSIKFRILKKHMETTPEICKQNHCDHQIKTFILDLLDFLCLL